MKQDEFERLCSVSAKLKKGLENISSGRVESGRVWIEAAASIKYSAKDCGG